MEALVDQTIITVPAFLAGRYERGSVSVTISRVLKMGLKNFIDHKSDKATEAFCIL